MFGGIEIASEFLEPDAWEACLYIALALAAAWVVGKFGPSLAWKLAGREQATHGTLPNGAPATDAAAVERIAVALAASDGRSDGARGAGAAPGGDGTAGSPPEVMRKGRPKRAWLCAGEGEEEPFLCWITERGRDGLGIIVDRLVPIGTPISLRPTDAPEGTPLARLEVCNCRRKGKRWHIGCRFSEDLPSMLRLLLG
jgi:hypothetical protein